MEITIGVGLNNIIFGMSQLEVENILGKPNKVYEDEYEITYCYNNLLVELDFDKDNELKLHSIDVFNPQVLMFNQKRIGKEKKEIVDLLNTNGYKDMEHEDYGLFDTLFCEEIWSTFFFEFGRLRSIEFGHLYNGDEIVFPDKAAGNFFAALTADWAVKPFSFAASAAIQPEIKIGIGLDNIIFGMYQEEVKNILGEPDKISETEKEHGIVYYYNSLFIKTKFDKKEQCKLYSFEVYNPKTLMLNQMIIGKTKKEIEDLLNANGYNKFVYRDYDTFDTLFCKGIWSTFRFKFDRLFDIEFSPLSCETDKMIFPVREA